MEATVTQVYGDLEQVLKETSFLSTEARSSLWEAYTLQYFLFMKVVLVVLVFTILKLLVSSHVPWKKHNLSQCTIYPNAGRKPSSRGLTYRVCPSPKWHLSKEFQG